MDASQDLETQGQEGRNREAGWNLSLESDLNLNIIRFESIDQFFLACDDLDLQAKEVLGE